jgi:mono/diheme cytochrome c family protein
MNRFLLYSSTLLAAALIAAASAGSVSAADAQPDPASVEFFNLRVAPILKNNCAECHDANKVKGGLRMDTYAFLRMGGDDGTIVTPGDPDNSPMIQAVRAPEDADLVMPPKYTLPQADIDTLVAWVRAGAHGPDEAPSAQTATAPAPQRAPAAPPTNLKVLPKDLTNAQVRKIMDEWSDAIGADCSNCHVPDPKNLSASGKPLMDYVSDAKQEKGIARVMVKMVENINKSYLETVPNSGLPVSCGTCHRGHLGPEPFIPPAHTAAQTAAN